MDEPGNSLFKPGQSGNPLGRPKMDPVVKEMLRCATPAAAKALVDALAAERSIVVGSGDKAEVVGVPDHEVRMKAANAILDRLYGKPHQSISGEDGGPIRIDIDLLGTLQRLVGGGE